MYWRLAPTPFSSSFSSLFSSPPLLRFSAAKMQSILKSQYLRACVYTTATKHAAFSRNSIVSPRATRGMATPTAQTPKITDSNLLRNSAFINNAWVSAKSNKTFAVIDPATGEEIAKVPEMNVEDTRVAINAAGEAFKTWSTEPAKTRHDILKKWFDLVNENKEDLATILTWENGKTLTEARSEITYGNTFFEWFAEEAVRVYGDVIPSPFRNQRFVVLKQPVGVVGVITPWNFPNAMITRKVGAALAAGCTVVIKPGAETPLSALALAELAVRAGLPPGVLNIVTTNEHVSEVGLELCENKQVKKVSFTGSTAVGKKLMAQSSSTLKKLSFELGGNAPFIVFDDADVDAAVEGAILSKFRGTGQTCICANRILVHSSIYALFASRLADRVSKFRVGSGFDPETTHGPLINQRGVDKVRRHVEDAISHGAEALVGGNPVDSKGYFFEPTVLSGMTDEMVVSTEETFGPLAALYEFKTDDEAIARANATELGLAGYFYSRDIGRVWQVAEKLEVGMVGVNTGTVSSVYAPFGGVKESGFGREGSKYGLEGYLNIKYINMGGI